MNNHCTSDLETEILWAGGHQPQIMLSDACTLTQAVNASKFFKCFDETFMVVSPRPPSMGAAADPAAADSRAAAANADSPPVLTPPSGHHRPDPLEYHCAAGTSRTRAAQGTQPIASWVQALAGCASGTRRTP